MRKALLENEKVGKIAEDPKKMAFLRAIEDRHGDDGLDFLDEPEEPVGVDSQEAAQSQSQANQEKSATALGKRKRALTDAPAEKTNRLPANARRTVAARKPASLADIRASVSFLIEAPDAMPMPPPSSSPPASDNENDENVNAGDPPFNVAHNKNNPFTSRRTSNPVIDRLSLKRTSTSSSTASTSSSRLAFHDPLSTTAAFKVPSLLRRATTSSFNNGNGNSMQDSNGISTLAETERSAGGAEKKDFVRRGGTKSSSVNWVQREKRRVEGRVGEEVRKRVVQRQGSSLVGLGGGEWE